MVVLGGGAVSYERGTPASDHLLPSEEGTTLKDLITLHESQGQNLALFWPFLLCTGAPDLSENAPPPEPYRRPVLGVQGESWGGWRFLTSEIPLHWTIRF
jgi:hypothetical protein